MGAAGRAAAGRSSRERCRGMPLLRPRKAAAAACPAVPLAHDLLCPACCSILRACLLPRRARQRPTALACALRRPTAARHDWARDGAQEAQGKHPQRGLDVMAAGARCMRALAGSAAPGSYAEQISAHSGAPHHSPLPPATSRRPPPPGAELRRSPPPLPRHRWRSCGMSWPSATWTPRA